MIVIDEKLLKQFRTAGRCELCACWCVAREPHHVFARGIGGGTRLDVAINLLALGHKFGCKCHRLAQAYTIPRHAQLCAVAVREGQSVEAIVAEIYRLRREEKRAA
jgi:hypothetical protein